MATISITLMEPEIRSAIKTASKALVRPWEVLCGFHDLGNFLHPDIECKDRDVYYDHLGDYTDASTPLISKETGEIIYVPWYDEDLNKELKTAKYIKLRDKPKDSMNS